MDKPDLTIIYYTANKLKASFAKKVRQQITNIAGPLPIISISKKPIQLGQNIIEKSKDRSVLNIYNAILRGAKAAKTKYVGLAEDDTLYPPDHFFAFRPPLDSFAYNLTRWNIHTWSKSPFFSIKFRRILATLIAPRQLLIDAIEERFAKYPNISTLPLKWMGEPGRQECERQLGVTPQKVVDFYTYSPVVVFSHPDSLGYLVQGTHKRANVIRALELPYWGTAKKVMRVFYKNDT